MPQEQQSTAAKRTAAHKRKLAEVERTAADIAATAEAQASFLPLWPAIVYVERCCVHAYILCTLIGMYAHRVVNRHCRQLLLHVCARQAHVAHVDGFAKKLYCKGAGKGRAAQGGAHDGAGTRAAALCGRAGFVLALNATEADMMLEGAWDTLPSWLTFCC